MPTIRSVAVPFGFQLELYYDNQYQQVKEVIINGGYTSKNFGCHDITNIDFTNIALRKLSDFEAEGHWVQSKYNGDIKIDMQPGFYSADGSSIEQTDIDIR